MITPTRKAKILWQCRRGMLELDLFLKPLLEQGLETLDEENIEDLETLLQYSDPELNLWLMDYESPPAELKKIVDLIRFHHSAQ